MLLLLLLLLLSLVLSTHLTSAQILERPSASQNIPPAAFLPSSDNTTTSNTPQSNNKILTPDENISSLLRSLSLSPNLQLNSSTLLGLTLTAGGRPPNLTRSSHIGDFRRIAAYFRSGGISPSTTPRSEQYFYVRNDWPQNWDRWQQPEFWTYPPLIWLEDKEAVDWATTTAALSIREADRLLKENGYGGEYEKVYLHQLRGRPLQYCFQGFGVAPGTGRVSRRVVVEVGTGAVREVGYDCFLRLRRVGTGFGVGVEEV